VAQKSAFNKQQMLINNTSKKPTYMLDNISLHVPKGDYISVIGDNGSR